MINNSGRTITIGWGWSDADELTVFQTGFFMDERAGDAESVFLSQVDTDEATPSLTLKFDNRLAEALAAEAADRHGPRAWTLPRGEA